MCVCKVSEYDLRTETCRTEEHNKSWPRFHFMFAPDWNILYPNKENDSILHLHLHADAKMNIRPHPAPRLRMSGATRLLPTPHPFTVWTAITLPLPVQSDMRKSRGLQSTSCLMSVLTQVRMRHPN